MTAIVNTKLVMEDGIIWDGALTYENGRIVEVGTADTVTIPAGAEIIDAQGLYTAPGLIDIHNHGSADDLFCDEPLKCSEHFLVHGQTTVLPTFYHDLDLNRMLDGAAKIREVSKSGAGRIMDGLYMEGPYMSGSGSNKKYIKWIPGEIMREEYEPLLAGLGDMTRVWAIDPSREGIIPFMQDAKKNNPNVVFALGHSKATMDQCRKVYKYGVKVRTHYTNGGKAKGRCQGSLGAGCDEFAMYTPEMFLELICDQTGVHVTPDLIKTIVRNKGVEKMILITDSMASKERFPNNMEDGIWFGPDLNYDYRGYLCGSRMTLENGCRNMMTHTGYGLCHSIRMATINPARMLGIDDEVGSLEAGKKANLIIIDDAVRVKKVVLQGDLMVDGGKLL